MYKRSGILQITLLTSALSIYKFIWIKPFTYTIFTIPHQLPQILEDVYLFLKKPCQRKEEENMLFWAILTSIILFRRAFIFEQQTATWKTSYQWLKNMFFSYYLGKIQLPMRKRGTKALLILYLPCHLFRKALSLAKLLKSLTTGLIIILLSLVLTFKLFKRKNNWGTSLRKQTSQNYGLLWMRRLQP